MWRYLLVILFASSFGYPISGVAGADGVEPSKVSNTKPHRKHKNIKKGNKNKKLALPAKKPSSVQVNRGVATTESPEGETSVQMKSGRRSPVQNP